VQSMEHSFNTITVSETTHKIDNTASQRMNCRMKKTPGLKSASELYRPSDRRLSGKLVPTVADEGCRVVSATNPHGG
jgi:hypothetical protein